MKIRRHAAVATALLAVGAPLLAACGSSGSPSATATPSKPPMVLPTADCAAVMPLAQGGLAGLSSLTTMPPAQAKTQLDQFINQLQQAANNATSPQTKADVQNLINALQSAESSGNPQTGAMAVLPAVTKIVNDCGGSTGS